MRATGWTSHAEPAVPEDAVGFERSSADLWSRLVGQHARPTAITRNVLQPTWVLLVVWLSHAPESLAINGISAKLSPTPTAYLAPMSPARGEPVTPLGWESHCLPPGLCELCPRLASHARREIASPRATAHRHGSQTWPNGHAARAHTRFPHIRRLMEATAGRRQVCLSRR